MDNNGWSGKPGVPLNPERDGWHWCERDGGLEPRFWSSGQQLWAGVRNSWITPKMVAALFNYAGPCLTPAEVDARVQQARRDALEEAAQVADKHAHGSDKKFAEVVRKASAAGNSRIFDLAAASAAGMDHEARKIAAAIRALKGEGHE
jgi:hypothetical protein